MYGAIFMLKFNIDVSTLRLQGAFIMLISVKSLTKCATN